MLLATLLVPSAHTLHNAPLSPHRSSSSVLSYQSKPVPHCLPRFDFPLLLFDFCFLTHCFWFCFALASSTVPHHPQLHPWPLFFGVRRVITVRVSIHFLQSVCSQLQSICSQAASAPASAVILPPSPYSLPVYLSLTVISASFWFYFFCFYFYFSSLYSLIPRSSSCLLPHCLILIFHTFISCFIPALLHTIPISHLALAYQEKANLPSHLI